MEARDERRARYAYGTEIPTRWADCDAYGHVNNVVYYSWFDTTITRMLFEFGLLSHASSAIGLCVESKCQFLAPVEFPATIEARVRMGRIGSKSLRYEVGVFCGADRAEPVAVGYFIHVFVDRGTRRPVALTEEAKGRLAPLVVS